MFFWMKVQKGRVFVVDRTSQGLLWIYSGAIDSIVAFNFVFWARHLRTNDGR